MIKLLNKKLVKLLIDNNYKISFAESCTGGLLAHKIVSVADASKVLDESYVTYANEAKIKLLNVNDDDIKKYGVVSEIVAIEMARGLKKVSNAEICVSTSGIAGPSGGSAQKPVGTVCFGFIVDDKEYQITKHFKNFGRQYVRNQAYKFVFKFLIKELR